MQLLNSQSAPIGAGKAKGSIVRTVLFSLLINGVLPLVVFNLLNGKLPEITALTMAALIPALENLLVFARHRYLDIFGLFMLAGLVLSILLVLLGGDQRFILVKESLLTGFLGLVMLASLLFPRPILFYFAEHFTTGNRPEEKATFETNWARPYFRTVMYLMTVVWGFALVGEALVRTILAFSLSSITEFLAISPVIMYGFLGITILWTVWYARHARRRGAQIRRLREAKLDTN